MRQQDNTEVWAAVAIGAIVGVGAALLVRARQDDEAHEIIKAIRPIRRRAAKTTDRLVDGAGELAKAAGKAGRRGVKRLKKQRPVDAGLDMLEDLSSRAREIVETTRKELEKAARDSVKEARKAARRAARRVAR